MERGKTVKQEKTDGVENKGDSRRGNALVVVCAKLWYNKTRIMGDSIGAEGPRRGQGEKDR